MKRKICSEDYMYADPSVNEYWNNLVEFGIATEDELSLVTAINGYSIDTLDDVLYARTGYDSWDGYAEDIEE